MTQQESKQPQNRQVRIEINDDTADGTYANISFIANNNAEFILDFARFLPGNTRGKVVSRVVMAPIHAKSLLKSLNDAVERFEKQHGTISVESVNKNIGFAIDKGQETKDKE